MSDLLTNARRMLQLFEQMRETRPGPGLVQLKELNLSFSHMRALRLLAPNRVLSMKDLAEELQLTPPSVTALTRRLVQTGLVQRSAHAEDSRVMLLSLTTAGQRLHEQLTHEHVERMAALLQGLSDQEQRQFLALLERAVNAMQQDAPAADQTRPDLPAQQP